MEYVLLWLNIAGMAVIVLIALGILFSPLFLAFYLVMRINNYIWARLIFILLMFIQIVNLIFLEQLKKGVLE